jgi:hypothetical protein
MVQSAGGILKAGGDIVTFEIRIISEDISDRLARSEQLKHVCHAYPHAANAWAAASLLRINCDSLKKLIHTLLLIALSPMMLLTIHHRVRRGSCISPPVKDLPIPWSWDIGARLGATRL